MNTRLPFVYLASQPFSGSTLLSILVNAHPEIATVGEMTGLIEATGPEAVDPYTYTCSCGVKIMECPFWLAVSDSMRSRGHAFEVADFGTRFELGRTRLGRRLRTGSLRSNWLEHLRDGLMTSWWGHSRGMQDLGARNQAFAESVLEVTGKRVFFDAAKYHMAIKYLQKYTDVDLKVVHLVRDVRGATASLMRHIPGLGLEAAVKKWIWGNLNVERQLAHLPSHRHVRIRYEDLCQNPELTLRRLVRFCGVDPSVDLTIPQESPGCIVGNFMRLKGVSEIKLDERWRRTFTESQLRTIERAAGELHLKYGYSSMGSDAVRGSSDSSRQPAAIA